MTYQEMMENAKLSMGLYCKACPVCDGRACKNQIPGPGAKGVGDTAIRNYKKWQEIRVNMDTICDGGEADTSVNLFGKEFKMPFFAGPVGAVNLHYSDRYDDVSYNNVLVSACADAGIAAFTGDGVNAKVMEAATEAIRENDGCGIPTVKPWNLDTVREKMELVKKSGAFAVAMDIDAAGLPFLKNMNPPAGSKNVQELSEIVKMAGRPFIVKGVMTAKGARKAKEAGADAIIVSNHGGRVLDQCPATAEVLEEIVKEVNGSMKILVDGGIRSGTDIFKALALGADGVLICRPFVVAVYGGGEEGVKLYIDKLGAELKDAMQMCGAHSLAEITPDMVRVRAEPIKLLSALSIFSRNFIFMDRAIPGRLRSAGNCIFTGEVVQTNGIVIFSECAQKSRCIKRYGGFCYAMDYLRLASRFSIFFSGSMMLETDISWFSATTK